MATETSEFLDGLGAEVDDCVGLWTEQSELVASRRWGEDGTIPWIEDATGTADVLAKPGNHPSAVVDPDTGANILAFPVKWGFVEGYAARSDDGELRAAVLWVDED